MSRLVKASGLILVQLAVLGLLSSIRQLPLGWWSIYSLSLDFVS